MSNRRKTRKPRQATPPADTAGAHGKIARAARLAGVATANRQFAAALRQAETEATAGRIAAADAILAPAWDRFVKAVNAADAIARPGRTERAASADEPPC